MKKSYADIEAKRVALGTLSRADLTRRAGVSESAFTKGLAAGRYPQKHIRQQLELVLDAESKLVEAGLR